VPLPRLWGVRPLDVVALLVGNGVFIFLMWLRHGGPEQFTTLGGSLSAMGQLLALYGTYLALIQLVLMGRSPWLDEAFGMDRLAWAHRWLGFATVWLIAGHVATTIVGYAISDGSSLVGETANLLGTYAFVLWGLVGFVLFVVIAVSSLRASRRRLPYEAWFWLHVGTYLAIAFAFLHQLFSGSDFIHDPVAAAYWVSLYVIAFGLILVFRLWQPWVTSSRHQLRVAGVVPEAPGVTSIYLTGQDLDRLPVRSGQYFVFRFLTRDGWWRGHPFSLSSAPNGSWLRITVKALGDGSERISRMAPGTRVFVEGPYGIMTGVRRTRRRVTLIAGGIGIAPLRALLESLAAAPGDLTLLYRASSPHDLVFRSELDMLAAHRGAVVHYLVGRRQDLHRDPLAAVSIRSLVPDIADQDVYLCGPDGMMDAVEGELHELGVPPAQLHAERFSY
jgi:predicted ferric reductase